MKEIVILVKDKINDKLKLPIYSKEIVTRKRVKTSNVSRRICGARRNIL